jgi:HSP20 family protein
MEVDKLKKWLDVAQQFQTEQFWNQIFDEKKQNKPGTGLSLNPLTVSGELIPKCDLYETEHDLIIEVEIPGLGKEDLHISLHQQLLTITGEFKTLLQNRKYFLKERANRKFKKELTLPYPVSVNHIRTEIHKGVLVIVLPINREEVESIPITFNPTAPS